MSTRSRTAKIAGLIAVLVVVCLLVRHWSSTQETYNNPVYIQAQEIASRPWRVDGIAHAYYNDNGEHVESTFLTLVRPASDATEGYTTSGARSDGVEERLGWMIDPTDTALETVQVDEIIVFDLVPPSTNQQPAADDNPIRFLSPVIEKPDSVPQ